MSAAKAVLPLLLAPLLLLTLAGCASQPASGQSFALDTLVSVTVYEGGGEAEVQRALALCDQLEARWSAHLPDSEISRLNASGGAPCDLPADTLSLLSRALDVSARSGGGFDVSLGAVKALWEGDPPALPDPQALEAALRGVGPDALRVEAHSAILTHPAARVDLGGVAKGAIGDSMAAELIRLGVRRALIDLGGNIVLVGRKEKQPWRIGVRNPAGEGLIGQVETEGGAVATSSDAQRYVEVDGVRYGHILDPKTGYPADSGLVSATVLAPDGLTADALSTACFVLGEERALALLKDFPGVEAVLVRADGSVTATQGARFTPLN